MSRGDVIASQRLSPCGELELEVNTPFLSPLNASGQAEAMESSQHHSGDRLSNCRAKPPSRPCLTNGIALSNTPITLPWGQV